MIGYLRVSTKRQGDSGLGLEAQKAAIEDYADREASRVLAYYTEVETGKAKDRPELAKALAHARRSKSTLVVAKLDRLARNVAFLSAMMEAGVEFKACDNPHANRFTLHILAAVAEEEARAISVRTKAALAAYKARGGLLGANLPQCNKLSSEARQRGLQRSMEARQKRSREAVADLLPVIVAMDGLSLRDRAAKLNEMGHTTTTGKPWNPVQVMRVLRHA